MEGAVEEPVQRPGSKELDSFWKLQKVLYGWKLELGGGSTQRDEVREERQWPACELVLHNK